MRFRPYIVVLAPLLALWVLENFVGERTGLTALLLYLPQHPWALWPLFFFGFGLLKRRRAQWTAGALGFLFWSHFLLGFQVFRPLWSEISSLSSDDHPLTVRVVSYNLQRGEPGAKALQGAIRAQHPDIVCLQESQGRYKDDPYLPGVEIAAHFPGWSGARSGDVMTFSRFPIVSQRDFPLRGTRRILETTLQTPKGPLRVLNVHVSTSFSSKPYAAKGKIARLIQIVREAKPGAQARMEQIEPIRKAILAGDSQIPLVMAGDFNSPPRGLFYGAISRSLDDAWQSGGRGTGSTYPSNFPLLPIDHVLTRGIWVKYAFVPDERASDHRPFVVDFEF